MDDIEERLAQCFAIVFPELKNQDITSAGVENLDSWDSMASVTLFAVIEEEFDISIQPDHLESLISFDQCLRYLRVEIRSS